ncbi:double-strand break repair protein MRE11 [Leguminivora glycinivorella]|uniref:double-strand break repair protein MRE11 n=1 Tax=Leguminivora glycinivorella TaxID=1035111 RepID=UPI00200F4731|nr:double-strand break repair protein MRE11 [Leguminivora glycinivorella]
MLNTDMWNPDNTLKILIASDIHLGHEESDPVRGEDSFLAFEEVLAEAAARDVDLVLLGGDLFHHSKPSPACMFKCTELIRQHCFGDKPVRVELLSDQLENFSRNINYEDPNLNVSFPILSIHGNHDDPVGQGSVSSLDILSITGLVNYFGKWSDYTRVRISPVLLRKGSTQLALYGLSHLKDQRLARLFAEKKVEMEMVDDSNNWFNMLVLHQNRADRGPGNFIPEKVLPKFLDLVVWGHEHDSLVFPIKGEKNDDFMVVQPGSTVATSLAAGEALQKHCALLEIHGTNYKVTPIPLKTVRPFIFKTIVLSEEDLGEEEVNEHEKVQEFLKNKVNEAIEEANNLRSGHPKQPTLPLIRLSVFYERPSQDFNRMRFGQNFTGQVANPNDVLIMKREKKYRERKETEETEEVDVARAAHEAADVEALLAAYYAALPPARQPVVLSARAATEAVRDFTLKHDDGVFRRVFDAHRRRAVEALLDSTAETDEEIMERMRLAKDVLDSTDLDQLKMLVDLNIVGDPAPKTKPRATSKAAVKTLVVVSSDDESLEPSNTSRGGKATRSRGRGPRGPRGRPARAAASPAPAPATPEPERRAPRRAATKASWLTGAAAGRTRNSSSIEDSD